MSDRSLIIAEKRKELTTLRRQRAEQRLAEASRVLVEAMAAQNCCEQALKDTNKQSLLHKRSVLTSPSDRIVDRHMIDAAYDEHLQRLMTKATEANEKAREQVAQAEIRRAECNREHIKASAASETAKQYHEKVRSALRRRAQIVAANEVDDTFAALSAQRGPR